jgi:hypothetical protein
MSSHQRTHTGETLFAPCGNWTRITQLQIQHSTSRPRVAPNKFKSIYRLLIFFKNLSLKNKNYIKVNVQPWLGNNCSNFCQNHNHQTSYIYTSVSGWVGGQRDILEWLSCSRDWDYFKSNFFIFNLMNKAAKVFQKSSGDCKFF